MVWGSIYGNYLIFIFKLLTGIFTGNIKGTLVFCDKKSEVQQSLAHSIMNILFVLICIHTGKSGLGAHSTTFTSCMMVLLPTGPNLLPRFCVSWEFLVTFLLGQVSTFFQKSKLLYLSSIREFT